MHHERSRRSHSVAQAATRRDGTTPGGARAALRDRETLRPIKPAKPDAGAHDIARRCAAPEFRTFGAREARRSASVPKPSADRATRQRAATRDTPAYDCAATEARQPATAAAAPSRAATRERRIACRRARHPDRAASVAAAGERDYLRPAHDLGNDRRRRDRQAPGVAPDDLPVAICSAAIAGEIRRCTWRRSRRPARTGRTCRSRP